MFVIDSSATTPARVAGVSVTKTPSNTIAEAGVDASSRGWCSVRSSDSVAVVGDSHFKVAIESATSKSLPRIAFRDFYIATDESTIPEGTPDSVVAAMDLLIYRHRDDIRKLTALRERR